MIEHYFLSPRVRVRLRNNPIRARIARLVEDLHRDGYHYNTIHQYVRAAEHFGMWLSAHSRKPYAITKASADAFLCRHLPECVCAVPASRSVRTARAALRHMLRAEPPVPGVGRCGAESPARQLVQEYVAYLETTCGLAVATCRYRARYAREFLAAHAARGKLRLRELKPQFVMRYTAAYAKKRKRSSAQVAAGSVRSFLRYLHMRGLCGEAPCKAVPRIARWRMESLPKVMTEEQALNFLTAFDRSCATGRRDYAMALYMVELGLRVSEVAELQLDDVDWSAGTVLVRSPKGRRTRLLPLTGRIGKATASYLRAGRPPSTHRHVFLRHRVPTGVPVSRALIRGVVRRAYVRTGCPRDWTGTHILRHTAATRLLQRGASIKDIADLLGHQSIDTSAIYSKVDLPALASVAMPWPEVEP